jgi:hypothetical protein
MTRPRLLTIVALGMAMAMCSTLAVTAPEFMDVMFVLD